MIKIRNGDLFSHFFALRFSLTYKSHVKGRKGVQHKKRRAMACCNLWVFPVNKHLNGWDFFCFYFLDIKKTTSKHWERRRKATHIRRKMLANYTIIWVNIPSQLLSNQITWNTKNNWNFSFANKCSFFQLASIG